MKFRCKFCKKEISGLDKTIKHVVDNHYKEVLKKLYRDNELFQPYFRRQFIEESIEDE